MELNVAKPARWIRPLLFIAFAYSLVWGLAMVLWPELVFHKAAVQLPQHLFVWQTLGVVEIVLALGYLLALANPYKHWSPVLMGMVFKAIATAIFLKAALANGELLNLRDYVFVNNLIWLLPFAAILANVYQRSQRSDDLLIEAFEDDQITLDLFETTHGIDLLETTHRAPTMVVFLRHFGCTFCREALQDLSQQRAAIEAKGVRLLLVHMLEDGDEARRQVAFYGPGLEDLPMVGDPEAILYKKFKLRRGTLWQLLGGKVLFRGLVAGLLKGRGIGREMGDLMQMPGIFVMHHGQVLNQYVHRSSADRPPYIQIAETGGKTAA